MLVLVAPTVVVATSVLSVLSVLSVVSVVSVLVLVLVIVSSVGVGIGVGVVGVVVVVVVSSLLVSVSLFHVQEVLFFGVVHDLDVSKDILKSNIEMIKNDY